MGTRTMVVMVMMPLTMIRLMINKIPTHMKICFIFFLYGRRRARLYIRKYVKANLWVDIETQLATVVLCVATKLTGDHAPLSCVRAVYLYCLKISSISLLNSFC